MKISVLTLFPAFIEALKEYSIIGRAIREKIIELEIIDIRDFAVNKYLQVDDYPYGGGPGMLMMTSPIAGAINKVKDESSKVYFLTAQGQKLNQKKIKGYEKRKTYNSFKWSL